MKIGDEVLVQVSREGIKTKSPAPPESANFTGRYLVLTSQRKELGFSGKLKERRKKTNSGNFRRSASEAAGLIVLKSTCRDADTADILREKGAVTTTI